MEECISIMGLNKEFKNFSLKNINLEIPKGYVTGIVGNNGAGKTTLLKCISGAYVPSSGNISLPFEFKVGSIGMVYDEQPFSGNTKVAYISKLMRVMFSDWDNERYVSLCKMFEIPLDQYISKLSRGMRMKLQVAVALSHDADLIILDEPTAGMDPEARVDFLDLIRDYISDGERTVIISSHITSDLEKIADYLVFMYNGEVILTDDMESLRDEYGILRTGDEVLIPQEHIIHTDRTKFGTESLVKDKMGLREAYPELTIDDATIDDIMVNLIRGRRI